jgi:hypothetical protein
MDLLVRTRREARNPFFARNDLIGNRIDNKVVNRYRSQL